MHPLKLIERAAGTAVHVGRHPIASAAYAAGLARGLAAAAVHGVTVTGHDPDAGQVPTPPTSRVPEPQRVAKPVPEPGDLPDPIVIEPEPAGEAFATEPKATSRDSEHGRSGDDEDIDEWSAMAEETDQIDIETPVGTTGADVGHNPDTAEADLQQPGTEPLLDPGTAKSVRSEAAMMQRAADPDKD